MSVVLARGDGKVEDAKYRGYIAGRKGYKIEYGRSSSYNTWTPDVQKAYDEGYKNGLKASEEFHNAWIKKDFGQITEVRKSEDGQKWLAQVKAPLGTKVFEIPAARAKDASEVRTEVEKLMASNINWRGDAASDYDKGHEAGKKGEPDSVPAGSDKVEWRKGWAMGRTKYRRGDASIDDCAAAMDALVGQVGEVARKIDAKELEKKDAGDTCPVCKGEGEVRSNGRLDKCEKCNGTGKVGKKDAIPSMTPLGSWRYGWDKAEQKETKLTKKPDWWDNRNWNKYIEGYEAHLNGEKRK